MLQTVDEPVFCLTSDMEWASDFAIREQIAWLENLGIRPTLFATHASPVLDDFQERGAGEIGMHPNFLPGSSHGSTFVEVIDYIRGLFPAAQTYRSHSGFDSSLISHMMVAHGIRYASNFSSYFQPHLVPVRAESGLVQFPVFWEEDIHWHNVGPDWDLDKYLPLFLTPGLKVLNCHPFMVQTNCPDHDYYLSIKSHISTLSSSSVRRVRHNGAGCQTFLSELLDRLLSRGFRFHTLGELYVKYPIRDFLPASHPDQSADGPRISGLAKMLLAQSDPPRQNE